LIVVNIVLKERKVFDCSYLYTLHKIYKRLSNINDFCPYSSGADENMLALEISCYFEDKIWNMSDKSLFDACLKDLTDDKFIEASEVKDFYVIRTRYAYPVYKKDYKTHLQKFTEHIDMLGNIFLLGRTGSYKYMDIDECAALSNEFCEKIL